MNVFGKKNHENVKAKAPEASASPYITARQEWLERYGSYVARAAQWRLFAFICLGLTCFTLAGNIFQALQQKIVPYVVEVDKLGKSVAVGRAEVAGEIPRRVIQAELAACIVDWRTVTPDKELQQKMISRLSAFVVGAAKGTLKGWLEENNPYERAKDYLVSVNIKGLPLPVSANSWRVEWTETVRGHSGATQSVTGYEATLTIAISPPTTDMQIVSNPGGVLITSISFSKLLVQQ